MGNKKATSSTRSRELIYAKLITSYIAA